MKVTIEIPDEYVADPALLAHIIASEAADFIHEAALDELQEDYGLVSDSPMYFMCYEETETSFRIEPRTSG